LRATTRPRIGTAEQIEVAHDVEDLVAGELVGKAQLVFTIFSSSTRMQLSRRPPLARPIAAIAFMS
jgi:hypothetical protein